MTVTVHHGDALTVMQGMPDASIDAVVTDPPYSISFMNAAWDQHERYQDWCQQWAAECLRVLKPGGHLLAFGGTRTYHRLACGIEDAGFEIRDSITWLYGSGFPKSLDVSKAIDKAAGADRQVIGERSYAGGHVQRSKAPRFNGDTYANGMTYVESETRVQTAPATDDARRWSGWGTALKPASEPIVVARKPLTGTVASNVLAYGTGALNIDATRVPHASAADLDESVSKNQHGDFGSGLRNNRVYGADNNERTNYIGEPGRWPTNVVLSHDEDCGETCPPGCPIFELDQQSGIRRGTGRWPGARGEGGYGGNWNGQTDLVERSDTAIGGASRFYPAFRYQAKASAKERPTVDGIRHSTVKPLALMRWLVKLVVAPGGTVLDPFAGSGTTAEACQLEEIHCVAIERDPSYLPLIDARLARVQGHTA